MVNVTICYQWRKIWILLFYIMYYYWKCFTTLNVFTALVRSVRYLKAFVKGLNIFFSVSGTVWRCHFGWPSWFSWVFWIWFLDYWVFFFFWQSVHHNGFFHGQTDQLCSPLTTMTEYWSMSLGHSNNDDRKHYQDQSRKTVKWQSII